MYLVLEQVLIALADYAKEDYIFITTFAILFVLMEPIMIILMSHVRFAQLVVRLVLLMVLIPALPV